MNTRIALLAAVATAAIGLTGTSQATPPVSPVANGTRCSYAAIDDPSGEPDHMLGFVTGGPLTASLPAATISMRCTIQVGGANATHAGADSCSADSDPSLQVTELPATPCHYIRPAGVPVFICTQATINGMTWYWDATVAVQGPVGELDVEIGWTPSSSAMCDESVSQEVFPGPAAPVLENVVCVRTYHPPYWDVYTCTAVPPTDVDVEPPSGP
jgi:hypothetical protein